MAIQWVDVNVFNRGRDSVPTIITSSADSAADPCPICGLVASPFKSGAVDKGLQKIKIMAILIHPVCGNAAQRERQNMAGQALDFDPRKN
jgi:hypothetical protein